VNRLAAVWSRHAGKITLSLYAIIVVGCTVQRGVLPSSHTTFPIFRQSFYHLLQGRDLYALYPEETGRKVDDLFKYSPTTALLFAPVSLPPKPVGLLAWNAFNALILVYAVRRVAGAGKGWLALLLLTPEVLVGTQASSSNCLIAALILLAFAEQERGRLLPAALAVAVGTCFKIFPIAGAVFSVFHSRRFRFAAALGGALALLALLPLLVVPPHSLAAQYHSWFSRLTEDATIHRGRSVMRMISGIVPGAWPNWPVQVAASGLLLLPLAAGRRRWNEADFRLLFLCSLMVWVVLFNHEAERQSFVISSTGIVLWAVTRKPGPVRILILILSLLGLYAPPQLAAWLFIQYDLYRRAPGRAGNGNLVPCG
jgi:hypothetical protein